MTQIKSKKAKERIEYYSNDADLIYPLTKEQIIEVVAIAEQQAEDRHANELQELKDKAEEAFREFVQYYTAEAEYKEISQDVDYYIAVFTQKLNE